MSVIELKEVEKDCAIDLHQNIKKVIPVPPKPSCFPDDIEWESWCLSAKEGCTSPLRFCYDCTKECQQEMIKENKCDYPEFKNFGKE